MRAVDAPERFIRLGATGRVQTALGIWLPYAVTEWEEGRRWSWRVAGIPATGHRVEPRPGGCRVVFEVGMAAAPYAAVCWLALVRIGRLLAAAGE